MDEREWLTENDPLPMRVFIGTRGTPRKFLLFASASCRHISHLFPDARCSDALAVVERFADGFANEEELEQARADAKRAWEDADARCKGRRKRAEQAAVAAVGWAAAAVEEVVSEAQQLPDHLFLYYGRNDRGTTSQPSVTEAARIAAEANPNTRFRGSVLSSVAPATAAELAAQCHFLRDIFGNPFRRVSLRRAWRSPAILALAQAAYDHRTLPAGTLEPDRLAVLADALEEAGCDDAEILGHLRGPGPHVRGCFVIDTLLDKS